jgi:hypothetical protein
VTTSLLVLARRDPAALARFDLQIWLREPVPPPAWAVWLARVQQVARGEAPLGFWVGASAAPGAYVVDFDVRRDPPGFRGIWRVLDEAPVAETSEGSILLARRTQRIDGRKLGSNQTWRRAVAAAHASRPAQDCWDAQAFAETFLARS